MARRPDRDREQLAFPLDDEPVARPRRRSARRGAGRPAAWEQPSLFESSPGDSEPRRWVDYPTSLRPSFLAAAFVDQCGGSVFAARRFAVEIDEALVVLEAIESS